MSTSQLSLVSLVGERVRARRRNRGWTLDDLAERSGVSRRMLVNVEQGNVNASIATLLRLSEALGMGLPELVAPGRDGTVVEVVRAGERQPLWTGEHGGRAVLLAGITTPEVVELWDWTFGPGDAHASEPHIRGARELLSVIEGDVVVSVGGEEAILHVGDSMSFPGDTVHGYRNESTTPARFTLTVFEPGSTAAPR